MEFVAVFSLLYHDAQLENAARPVTEKYRCGPEVCPCPKLTRPSRSLRSEAASALSRPPAVDGGLPTVRYIPTVCSHLFARTHFTQFAALCSKGRGARARGPLSLGTCFCARARTTWDHTTCAPGSCTTLGVVWSQVAGCGSLPPIANMISHGAQGKDFCFCGYWGFSGELCCSACWCRVQRWQR